MKRTRREGEARAAPMGEAGGGIMNIVFRTTLLAAWLLGIGLLAVTLESEKIRVGHRIETLLDQRGKLIENIRRLEVRYNRLVSPAMLERELPESLPDSGRLMAAGRSDARN